MNIVWIAQASYLKASHDVGVRERRAAQAAHVIPIHEIKFSFLAAGKTERCAWNEKNARGAKIDVTVLKNLACSAAKAV